MSAESGENFLVEAGAIQRRTPQRRQILKCLGCRWNATANSKGDPSAYGLEIVKCSGISSGIVYPSLSALEKAGVIISHSAKSDQGGPDVRAYSPSDDESGQTLAAHLGPPTNCNLPSK